MRQRVIAAISGLATVALAGLLAAPVRADGPPTDVAAAASGADDAAARPPQRVGYAALPGGIHVAAAETLPPGTLELGLLSGFGYRKGLVAADHTFDRAIGQLAFAYAPVANLALALSLDGRYDKHDVGGMTDDGAVGDPHLIIRYAAPLGRVAIGAQLGVWIPGKDAPSIVAAATSVDARALVSIDAGFGTISLDAGFRLDNSAKAVDDRQDLSAADQVSLGASDYHAALAGAALRIPVGERWYVGFEGSADVFVGSGAPRPIVRGGGMFGVAVNDAISIIGYVEGAADPSLVYSEVMPGTKVTLVPYEPMVTGGLGLQARFGGPRPAARPTAIVEPPRTHTHIPVVVTEIAEVTGTVVDDAGAPVVGATVTVKLKNSLGHTITDGKGSYTIPDLKIGRTVDGKTELDDNGAAISVEVANKKPASATATLTRGANAIPRIALDSMLPPGQLRGVILNLGNSRPVAGATVEIEPGGITATSAADGKFTVDLPPGHYKLTVTAKGLAQQQLDVNIDPNGVAIKNIDLHR
jgi:hypothetical protein